MSQSAVLVGAILGAFVVYLAAKGRLNVYWSILSGSAAGASTATGGTSTTAPGTTTSPAPGTLLNPFAPGAGTGTITPLFK